MKKTLAIFLLALVLVCTTVIMVSAADAEIDAKIIRFDGTGNVEYTKTMDTYSAVTDGVLRVDMSADEAVGYTYMPRINIAEDDLFYLYDYPYVKFKYRSDWAANTQFYVDNYSSSMYYSQLSPTVSNDGIWKTVQLAFPTDGSSGQSYYNNLFVNTLGGTFPSETDKVTVKNAFFQFKDLKETPSADMYAEIEYIAFFKTEEDMLAYDAPKSRIIRFDGTGDVSFTKGGSLGDATVSVTENGAYRIDIPSGSAYGVTGTAPFQLIFNISDDLFYLYDYPYAKIKYRTNWPSTFQFYIPATKNFYYSDFAQKKGRNDGEWHVAELEYPTDGSSALHSYYDANGEMWFVNTTDSATFPSKTDKVSVPHVFFQLKNLSETATSDLYAEIEYIAFFRTEEDMKAYDHRLDIGDIYLLNSTQEEAKTTVLAALQKQVGDTATVELVNESYTAPIKGTATDTDGTDGKYTYKIKVTYADETTEYVSGNITVNALEYRILWKFNDQEFADLWKNNNGMSSIVTTDDNKLPIVTEDGVSFLRVEKKGNAKANISLAYGEAEISKDRLTSGDYTALFKAEDYPYTVIRYRSDGQMPRKYYEQETADVGSIYDEEDENDTDDSKGTYYAAQIVWDSAYYRLNNFYKGTSMSTPTDIKNGTATGSYMGHTGMKDSGIWRIGESAMAYDTEDEFKTLIIANNGGTEGVTYEGVGYSIVDGKEEFYQNVKYPWTGDITRWDICVVDSLKYAVPEGAKMDVEYIAFFSNLEDAQAFAGEAAQPFTTEEKQAIDALKIKSIDSAYIVSGQNDAVNMALTYVKEALADKNYAEVNITAVSYTACDTEAETSGKLVFTVTAIKGDKLGDRDIYTSSNISVDIVPHVEPDEPEATVDAAIADVNALKTSFAEGGAYATKGVYTAEAAKAKAESFLERVKTKYSEYTVTVNAGAFVAPVDGVSDGSYAFTVTVSDGETTETSDSLTMFIERLAKPVIFNFGSNLTFNNTNMAYSGKAPIVKSLVAADGYLGGVYAEFYREASGTEFNVYFNMGVNGVPTVDDLSAYPVVAYRYKAPGHVNSQIYYYTDGYTTGHAYQQFYMTDSEEWQTYIYEVDLDGRIVSGIADTEDASWANKLNSIRFDFFRMNYDTNLTLSLDYIGLFASVEQAQKFIANPYLDSTATVAELTTKYASGLSTVNAIETVPAISNSDYTTALDAVKAYVDTLELDNAYIIIKDTKNAVDGTVDNVEGTDGYVKFTVAFADSANNGYAVESDELTMVIEAEEYSENVTGIKLDKTLLSVEVGKTATVKATVIPSSATKKTVYWSTSDYTVATVSGGTVKGLKEGTATITATTADGGFIASCEVVVYEPNADLFTYEVASGNATIKAANTSISGEIIIPSTIDGYTVTMIGHDAFNGCTAITGIIIPDTVTRIGNRAFYNCNSLTEIVIPDSVTSIGTNAFNGCKSLKSIKLSANLKKIEGVMFSRCSSLESIEIPEGVTLIEYMAFRNCTSLKSIVIPKSVQTIDSKAFDGCTAITDVYYGGSAEEWTTVTFNDANDKTRLESANVNCDDAAVKSITFDVSTVNLEKGGKTVIGYTILPAVATNKNVVWSSSDEKVVTVKNGVVTAVGEGTATVTAVTMDGAKSASCTVNVTLAQPIIYRFDSQEAFNKYVATDNHSTVELVEGAAEDGVKSALKMTTMDYDAHATFRNFNVEIAKYKYVVYKVKPMRGGRNSTMAVFHLFERNTGIHQKNANGNYFSSHAFTPDASWKHVIGVLNVADTSATNYIGMRYDFYNDNGLGNETGDVMYFEYVAFFADYQQMSDFVAADTPVVRAEDVSIDMKIEDLTLEIGQDKNIYVAFTPANVTDTDVTWTSSDESVVKIEDGVIKTVGAGTATITVTTADGGFTDSVTVTVLENYTVTVHYKYNNGKKAADDKVLTVAKGSTYSVVSPEIADYVADAVVVGGTAEGNVEKTVKYSSLKVKEIVSIESIDLGAKAYNTRIQDLGLPANIKGKTATGEEVEFNVQWNSADYVPTKYGKQTISGTIRAAYSYEILCSDEICATVTISENVITSVKDVTLGKLPLDTTYEGLGLPEYVGVVVEGGATNYLPVVWNESAYDNSTAGEKTLTGTVTLESGFAFAAGVDNTVTATFELTAEMNGTADIIFVVDTTGSMDSYIKNVRNNINSFAAKLEADGVAARWALVDYRDIVEERGRNGNDAYPSRVVTNGSSEWYNDAASYASAIGSLTVGGGGDIPESAVDALKLATTVNGRDGATTFFILVTDANYKEENIYGIENMQQLIDELTEEGIIVSVVTNPQYYNKYTYGDRYWYYGGSDHSSDGCYRDLIDTTGGIFVNINSDFATELLKLKDMMKKAVSYGEVTSVEIVEQPKKTLYYSGDMFDSTGMAVRATYENGNSEFVTGYNVLPHRALSVDDTQVEIVYRGKSVKVNVTVRSSDAPVTAVTVSTDSLELEAGETATVTATVTPSYATNPNIRWTTSNPNVATVENGVITAVNAGEAIISVVTEDGGFSDEVAVTVTKDVPVEEIYTNAGVVRLAKGDTNTVKYFILPTDATETDVIWECDNIDVATVYNGVITAKGAGTATVTVKSVDGVHSASVLVIVNNGIVDVTGVALNKSVIDLELTQNAELKAIVMPSNASDKTVTWTSSNESVAKVTNGVVIAVAEGTATITATTADGSFTATCTVNVKIPTVAVGGVTLDSTSANLKVGGTMTLTATISPANATDKTLTWTSSNEDVAKVENGVVTAMGEGTATITVTTADGNFTATCDVTVIQPKATVIVGNAEGLAGQTVEVTVSLENNPGIAFMRLKVNYDTEALTLIDVKDAGILGNAYHSADYTPYPYTLYWDNGTATENYTANGTAVTLTFRINKGTATGTYDVSVSYNNDNDDIMDVDFNHVKLATVEGEVKVVNAVCGDVNCDGKITSVDSAILARYLAGWTGYDEKVNMLTADVNGDGKVTVIDSAILARYLANWPEYSELPHKD